MKAEIGLTTLNGHHGYKQLSLLLTSKSCVHRQNVIRDTVSTQRNPCVLREKFCCVDTESTHIVLAIPK